jgi:hypothetical protein
MMFAYDLPYDRKPQTGAMRLGGFEELEGV